MEKLKETLSSPFLRLFSVFPVQVGTQDNPGCMVRALNDLFQAMDEDRDNRFRVTMSYLEIYNEVIRDLLAPDSGRLDLRDDRGGR